MTVNTNATKPAVIAVAASEKYDIKEGRKVVGKAPFQMVNNGVKTPVAVGDIIDLLRTDLMRVEVSFSSNVREDGKYSVNYVREYQPEQEARERADGSISPARAAQGGLGLGLLATYKDGSQVFVSMVKAFQIYFATLLEEYSWIPVDNRAPVLATRVPEVSDVPTSDELAQLTSDSFVDREIAQYGAVRVWYSIGVNWASRAENTTRTVWINGDEQISATAFRAMAEALVVEYEDNDIDFDQAVVMLQDAGWTAQTQTDRVNDKPIYSPAFLKFNGGITLSVAQDDGKKVVAFISLNDLSKLVFGHGHVALPKPSIRTNTQRGTVSAKLAAPALSR